MATAAAEDPSRRDRASVFGRSWDASIFPKVIVFDVDETLWPFWIDTHTVPLYTRGTDTDSPKRSKKQRQKQKQKRPLGRSNDNITDGAGRRLGLFPETETVLTTLRRVPGLKLGYASRTGEPSWMEALAKTIVLEFQSDDDYGSDPEQASAVSMWDLPDYREIYPGSKLRHFRNISKQSGVACRDMLFFDDEPYSNREVASELGVTFVDASGGVSVAMVVRGLEEHARACLQRRTEEEAARHHEATASRAKEATTAGEKAAILHDNRKEN